MALNKNEVSNVLRVSDEQCERSRLCGIHSISPQLAQVLKPSMTMYIKAKST